MAAQRSDLSCWRMSLLQLLTLGVVLLAQSVTSAAAEPTLGTSGGEQAANHTTYRGLGLNVTAEGRVLAYNFNEEEEWNNAIATYYGGNYGSCHCKWGPWPQDCSSAGTNAVAMPWTVFGGRGDYITCGLCIKVRCVDCLPFQANWGACQQGFNDKGVQRNGCLPPRQDSTGAFRRYKYVKVLDACPECDDYKHGCDDPAWCPGADPNRWMGLRYGRHIDLTGPAFRDIIQEAVGYLKVQWKWAPCPGPGEMW